MIARIFIVAVFGGLLSAHFSRAGAADGGSGYTEPDFSKRLFNPDALSLENAEREAIVSALTALVGPIPGAEEVGSPARMKAMAAALQLDSMHAGARQANDALIAGEPPGLIESGYETTGEILDFLVAEALRLREAESEEEDAVFYPCLIEIVRAIDPEKWKEEGAMPGATANVAQESTPAGNDPGNADGKDPGPPGAGGPGAVPVAAPAGQRGQQVMQGAIEFKQRESALRAVIFGPGGETAVPCLLKVTVSEEGGPGRAGRFYSEAGIEPVVLDQLRAAIHLLEVRHSGRLGRQRFQFELTALDRERPLPLSEPRLGVTILFLLDSLITGAKLDSEISIGGSLPSANSRPRPRGRWGEILEAAGRGGAKALIVSQSAKSDFTDMLVAGDITPLLLVQAIELVEPAGVGGFLSVNRDPNTAKAMLLFSELRTLLSRYEPEELVANAKVQERLREVLDLFPDHLSAKLLLEHGSGSSSGRMSLQGSVRRVDALLKPIRSLREQADSGVVSSAQDALFADSAFALRRIRPSLAEGAISYCDAGVDLLDLIREYLKFSNRSTNAAEDKAAEIATAMGRVERLRTGLGAVLQNP